MPTVNVWVREKDNSPKTPEQKTEEKRQEDFAFALVSGYLCGYFNCICEHNMQPSKKELVLLKFKFLFFIIIPLILLYYGTVIKKTQLVSTS